jgi:SAM-dependent methyltransferase
MRVSMTKWETAQKIEAKYWFKRVPPDGFPQNALSLHKFEYNNRSYKDAADDIQTAVGRFYPLKGKDKVLQIGCGPLDIIHFWPTETKYGLDSLMDLYQTIYPLQDEFQIHRINATAEKFDPDGLLFDVVLATNILDHTYDVQAVIHNIKRALKNDGILYLSTNIYTFTGYLLRKMLNPLGIDRAHTYTFMKTHIDRLMITSGFKPIFRHHNTLKDQYRIMRDSGVRILKLLAVCHIPVFHYVCICKKAQY